MFDIDREMLTESSDFNITKIKTSEEFTKEEAKSARFGMGLTLLLGFTIGQTLMIFSRKPGTTGMWLTVGWLAGILVQAVWFQGHMENWGRIDATPFEALIAVQMVLWVPSFLIMFWRVLRRRHVPDRQPGLGIFNRFFPSVERHRADLLSDLIVGSMLAGLFHLIGSPVQCNWYLAMMVWITACYAFYYAQQVSWQLRARSARKRAQNWPQDVRGVHKL